MSRSICSSITIRLPPEAIELCFMVEGNRVQATNRAIFHLSLINSTVKVTYSPLPRLAVYGPVPLYMRPLYVIGSNDICDRLNINRNINNNNNNKVELYLITINTRIVYLYRSYNYVISLDISPSLNVIDTSHTNSLHYSGCYLLDSLYPCIKSLLYILIQPLTSNILIYNNIKWLPHIRVSIVAQGIPTWPIILLINDAVLTAASLPILFDIIKIQLDKAVDAACVWGRSSRMKEQLYASSKCSRDFHECTSTVCHAASPQTQLNRCVYILTQMTNSYHPTYDTSATSPHNGSSSAASTHTHSGGSAADIDNCYNSASAASHENKKYNNNNNKELKKEKEIKIVNGGVSSIIMMTDGVSCTPRSLPFTNILMNMSEYDIGIHIIQVGGGYSPHSPLGNVSDIDTLAFIASCSNGGGSMCQDSDLATLADYISYNTHPHTHTH
eukprot:GHVR01141897.1.p1 GENE.GHVR01141897.1~~GHVR01141897.1.p1  ORF type:complete len:443 (-),score=155.39 GHVR01141897.1:96-1424(-)